jgi:hypothetical protein
MVPLYVPGARPAGAADTVKVAFPAPANGVTDSQLPPVVVAALAVKLWEPVICRLCATGSVPFWVNANVSDDGLMVTGPLPLVTVNVTGISVITPVAVVRVTVP